MRHLPPLNGLQAFEAAARHLNFTEAAKELHCTQAAISQRVKSLESHLSRQLFIRKPNGLQLTEAGEAYLIGVTEALNVAASATEGLRGRKVTRTITLSAPASFLALWLTPRLDGFLLQHPHVEIRLNSAIWTDPNADLADVIVEVRDLKDINAYSPRLPEEHLVLVCAPGPANALKKMSLPDALSASRKINIQGRHDLWRRWADMVQLDGTDSGTGPRIDSLPDIKVDNAVLALEAACNGLGVTVAYSTYCSPYLEAGLLTALHATPSASLAHTARHPPGKPAWHPSYKLFDWLGQEFRQAKPYPRFKAG